MTLFFHSWVLRYVLLSFLIIFSWCRANDNKNEESIDDKSMNRSSFVMTNASTDTISVQTAEELIKHIKSNRVIELANHEYQLSSTLLIDRIKNLKIVGPGISNLLITGKNEAVLDISNCHNIQLTNLIIGHSESPGYEGEQGVLRISHSDHINISNCKLLGAGTFGLITYDVHNFRFSNSEITDCTALIFELEKSRNFIFENSKFQHNNLSISVMGGFTNSTKEISFENCAFLNNKPKMTGNPAFNFRDNYTDFDEKITFSNCRFMNNKGYKWYGDKIELRNCKIDTTDFIGLKGN